MHISRDGEVRDYSFHNSVIHSKERMTYDDVQKIIDGDAALTARYALDPAGDPEDRPSGATSFRSAGRKAGAIDFDLPEPMLTYDDKGDVTGIAKVDTPLFSSHH